MAATYEIITTSVLTSTTATVTFSSIPATYTDLVLIMNPIANTAANSYPYLRFNSDSGTNYSRTFLRGNGTTTSGDFGQNENVGYLIGGNVIQTSNIFNAIVHFNNYSNTTTHKNWLASTNSATGTNNGVELTGGTWRSTSAINNIVLYCGSNSFVSGSTFSLYGIKAGS